MFADFTYNRLANYLHIISRICCSRRRRHRIIYSKIAAAFRMPAGRICRQVTVSGYLRLVLYLSMNYVQPEKTFKEPRNRFQGIDSPSLCSLAGRYENPELEFLKSLWGLGTEEE